MALEPNSLSAPNYLKVSLLKNLILFFLLETYVDSSNLLVDNTLNLAYITVGADDPLMIKKWCLYLFQKLSSFEISRYSVLARMY